jgi:hypothetical protein
VVVSQVPTPLQSTVPSSTAVLWSALMSPNHAKVPLQRCSAQEGPPYNNRGTNYSELSPLYAHASPSIDVSL